ncbi:MAG: VCBS repeat-containing protein [Planctomycetes bacterium]|nr:VCBS repeat-containing protein [Planctomycetota bacterium]
MAALGRPGLGFAALVLHVLAPGGLAELRGGDKSGVKPQSISLPAGAGSVEGLGESFEPLLNTGIATFTVNLALPPRTNGLAPQLALTYNSGRGSSAFGIGWDVSVPSIRRQTDKGQPRYGLGEPGDTFILDGEELVRLTDGTYRAENESAFRRVGKRAGTDGWEAREKDGRILRFGLHPSREQPGRRSRIALPGAAPTLANTFSWLLDEIEDPSGNLVELLYESFADSPGQLYLAEARYPLRAETPAALRGGQPQHAVLFTYGPRADAVSDFRSGFEIRTARRCEEIRVVTVPDPLLSPGGQTVRRYQLGYEPESPAGADPSVLVPLAFSLLRSVTQVDASGSFLPPLRFEYYELLVASGDGATSVQAASGVPDAFRTDTGEAEIADVDGDGLPDLIHAGAGRHLYARNLGHGRFADPAAFDNAPGEPGVSLSDPRVALLDLDGDGRVDLVERRGPGAGPDGVVYRSLEVEAAVPPGRVPKVRWGRERYYASGLPYALSAPEVRLLDLDFDKAIDLLRSGDQGIRAVLNLGGAAGDRTWEERPELPFGHPDLADLGRGFRDPTRPEPDQRLHVTDMNGDRLLDLVELTPEGKLVRARVWPSRGCGRWAPSFAMLSEAAGRESEWLYVEVETGGDLRVFDVNADGLSDLVLAKPGAVRLWVNLGSGRWSAIRRLAGPVYASGTQLREADIDGNGTADLLWWNSALPPQERLRYLDFAPGPRPSLLKTIDNGLGKRTHIAYRSSTQDFLSAEEAGDPWDAGVPFSTAVVSRVTTDIGIDLDGRPGPDRYVVEYFYRDGFYDGFEKEFRGFGGATELRWGDDRYPELVASGAVHSSTTVARLGFHTGAPDRVDNDGDRAELQANGIDDDGDGVVDEADDGIDERDATAGREEEPLRGKLLFREVAALSVDGASPFRLHDLDGDGGPDWVQLTSTAAQDGSDNDLDGFTDEPDEARFTHDDFTFTREMHSWRIEGIHRASGGHELVPAGTLDPGREVRFAFPEHTDTQEVEGPGRRTLADPAEAPPVRTRRVSRRFDAFGNLTLELEHGVYPDSPELDDERQKVTEYALAGEAVSRWIVDRPARTLVLDEAGKVVAEKTFYYGDGDVDVTGDPLFHVGSRALLKREASILIGDTSVGRVAGDSQVVQERRVAHDRFGNPVLIVDPIGDPARPEEGHARVIEYDRVFHAYPVAETQHVGRDASGRLRPPLRMDVAYDLAFGKVIAASDFNAAPASTLQDLAAGVPVPGTERSARGNLTGYAFDSHGRLVKEVKPGDTAEHPTRVVRYVHADPARELVYAYESSGGLAGGVPQAVSATVAAGGMVLELDSTASAVITEAREETGRADGLVSIQLLDGAQHKLGVAEEGSSSGELVVRDLTLFDSRGQARRTFQPYPSRLSAIMAPLPGTPSTDYFRDAAGRVEETLLPPGGDGVRDLVRAVYLPLERRQLDPEDNRDGQGGRPLSPHGGTYKAAVRDGLDRVVRAIEAVRLNDDGTPSGELKIWSTSFEYDLLDDLLLARDAQGNERVLRFDSLRRMVTVDDPDFGRSLYTYDAASNLVAAVDSQGQEIRLAYDGVNRLVSEDFLDEGLPFSRNRSPDVRYHYDVPVGAIDLGDGTRGEARNTAGLLAWVEDLSGEEHHSYDARRRIEWVVKRVPDPYHGALVSYRSQTSHDSLDRPRSLAFPDGDRISFEYGPRGLLRAISGGPSGSIVEGFRYAPSGQPLRFDLGNGAASTFGYDQRLRMVALAAEAGSPRGSTLFSYAYDFDGAFNIVAIRDLRAASEAPDGSPRRNTQRFTFDDLYRLTGVEICLGLSDAPFRSDGRIDFRYDRIGNMVSKSSDIAHAEDGTSITHLGGMRYGEGEGGLAAGRGGGWGRQGRGAGDPAGPHALTSTESGRRFSYDANGSVVQADSFTYTWDFKRRLIRVEGAATITEHVYDHADRRVLRKVTKVAADGSLLDPSFTLYIDDAFEIRDGDQPVKHAFREGTRVASTTSAFAAGSRLVQRLRLFQGWNLGCVAVAAPDAAAQVLSSEPVQAAFRWDRSGQRFAPLQRADDILPGTVLWVLALRDGTIAIRGIPGGSGPVQVLAGGDFVGLPVLRAIPLAQVVPPSAEGVWLYDARERRWRLKLTEVPSSPPELPELLAPGQALFVRAREPSAIQLPAPEEGLRFYHTDHLGSVAAVTDGAGRLVEEQLFYPFGKVRFRFRGPSPESSIAPFEYIDKEPEPEGGLHYFGNRFYEGATGRFVSVDPLRQFHAPYSYAGNNPIVAVDREGLEAVSEVIGGEKLFDDWFDFLNPFNWLMAAVSHSQPQLHYISDNGMGTIEIDNSADAVAITLGIRTNERPDKGRTGLDTAMEKARELRRPVYYIENDTRNGFADVVESALTKLLRINTATVNAIRDVARGEYAGAGRSRITEWIAYSQGGINLSEGLREAGRSYLKTIERVTTLGAAAWSYPSGPKEYVHFVSYKDPIAVLLGKGLVPGGKHVYGRFEGHGLKGYWQAYKEYTSDR